MIIRTFDEILNESKYYKTEKDESFMIFKNNDIMRILNIVFDILKNH